MNTNDKDLALADFLDGKLSEAALLAQFPDLAEEVADIKRSLNALGQLPMVTVGGKQLGDVAGTALSMGEEYPEATTQTTYSVSSHPSPKEDLPESLSGNENRRSQGISLLLSLAAGIALLTLIGLQVFKDTPPTHPLLADNFTTLATDQKMVYLMQSWNDPDPSPAIGYRLLEIAQDDPNASVRYLALQLLARNPTPVPESQLLVSLTREDSYNNQTAWIELWSQLYGRQNQDLQQWLERKDTHPMVRNFGQTTFKNL